MQATNQHHNNKLYLHKTNTRQLRKRLRLTKHQRHNLNLATISSQLSKAMVSNRRSLTLSHSKAVMRLSRQLLRIKRQLHLHSALRHSHSKTSLQIWMTVGTTISRFRLRIK